MLKKNISEWPFVLQQLKMSSKLLTCVIPKLLNDFPFGFWRWNLMNNPNMSKMVVSIEHFKVPNNIIPICGQLPKQDLSIA